MAMTANTAPTLALSVKEFCASLGICKASFYKLVKTGTAPPMVRIGHRLVIARTSAEAWLKARELAA
jgi:predicted DNA-binding transcriptional regulator AlpA